MKTNIRERLTEGTASHITLGDPQYYYLYSFIHKT